MIQIMRKPPLHTHPERVVDNRTSQLKFAFDYTIAFLALCCSLPVITIIAIAIKITDRKGPIFFIQQREGLDGKSFPCIKFRTMFNNAEAKLDKYLEKNPALRKEWESTFELEPDPRVLPITGNLLRKTSLDELPNLFNILRGEMSLVGPRPFPTYHLDYFDQSFREKRATVRPGLTGLWQIYRGDLHAQKHWDETYIDTWSLKGDISILIKTIPVVLFARSSKTSKHLES